MSEDRESEDLILDTPVGEGSETAPEDQEHIEGEEAADELEVSFGDEAAPEGEDDRNLPNKLRGVIKDKDKENAELRRQLAAATPAPKPVEVGPKPTIEGHEYDEDAYDAALLAWNQRKAQADDAGAAAAREQEETAKAWKVELDDFSAKKAAMKAPDFEAAEEEVVAGLTQMQQAIVIKAADDSAKVIYALGKHPAKLAEIAKITDPIKFAAAIVRLEGTIKVTPRRQAPEPEGIVRGSARLSTQTDKVLEKLEKEADRTGDRTAVVAHKRKIAAQARK